MNGWWRFNSTRANDAAVPVAAAFDVASCSPHRFYPGPWRSERRMSGTGHAAVVPAMAGPILPAVRSGRGATRASYRSPAAVAHCTGPSAGAGLVSPFGRTVGVDGRCRTGLAFRGGPIGSTGGWPRDVVSGPYRPVRVFQQVPGNRSYRSLSRTGRHRLGGFGGRGTTRDCSGWPSPATAEARRAQCGRRPPLNPGVTR